MNSLNRRQFINESITLATAAALMFDPNAVHDVHAAATKIADKSAEEAARDENFWMTVQQAFDIDRRYIPLNGGANNSSPRTVQNAFIRYIEFVNGAPLRNQYDVLFPHRETARIRLAKIANCFPDEIALTRNTTESLNVAIFGIDLKSGDEVLATNLEYYSMQHALEQRVKRDGIQFKKVPIPLPPKNQDELVEVIENAITPNTRLILISHIIDATGQIMPVKRICEVAHKRKIQVIVDGALSFGYIDVDLKDLDCDYYGTSLHKGMHAPLGTGFLFVKREKISQLWPLFGSYQPQDDIRKFESIGTHPVAQFAAINQTLDFHESIGTARKRARLHYLKRLWADKLLQEPNVRFYTALEAEQSCAIANVQFKNTDPEKLYRYLLDKHRMQAWPIKDEIIQGLWAAPLIYSRVEDVEAFGEVLLKVAREGVPG